MFSGCKVEKEKKSTKWSVVICSNNKYNDGIIQFVMLVPGSKAFVVYIIGVSTRRLSFSRIQNLEEEVVNLCYLKDLKLTSLTWFPEYFPKLNPK